ncbi:MAG TPA: PIN domain-containing protein [Kiritimatiellia bacterium]|jgi:predicted nucleic acid-binding protein|nr:PIN domain-containing protein [Kiritimatiellia bacterium]HQA37729.1 PIN domain-containing protein [Kiritimatiellia bacterium]HQL50297.1 PIN domain-containing protein [Kiritimatiellia bacterium]
MRLTIDANIWVGALDVRDPFSATCRACLSKAAEKHATLYSPLLLPIEVAATIGRKTRDTRHGRSASRWVRGFKGHLWQPLSEEVAQVAERFAATLFLRGADAVYVAAAHLSDAVLLTYDSEVVERASETIRVMAPDTWLRL